MSLEKVKQFVAPDLGDVGIGEIKLVQVRENVFDGIDTNELNKELVVDVVVARQLQILDFLAVLGLLEGLDQIHPVHSAEIAIGES